MPINRSQKWRILAFLVFYGIQSTATAPWTPIIVKNVTELGPQLSPGVTDVSRDGGYTALINGNIVWLYDDTECFDREGKQLSFVSNTAAYSAQPSKNVSSLTDFGVVNVGKDKNGNSKFAILADTTVATGGWIPFQHDELAFNKQKKGQERVAIWPGTSPTSISTTQAFLYAPLVYVDSKPQDPSKEYQARGMTMIAITAPNSGPVATRKGDLIIPGTEVAFGGFSSLFGFKSTDSSQSTGSGDRDVYLLGMTDNGLQLARAGMNNLNSYNKYSFYDPEAQKFSTTSPDPNLKDTKKIYLPGTFSSGSVFYSPYFSTFVMIYFNKMVDSTFYMRYLNLDKPLGADATWVTGGKNGEGIVPEDVEALVKYAWSSEQKLWASPTSKGGFNYAGMAHPEFFNRQYFAPSLYSDGIAQKRRVNDWYGSSLINEKDAGSDGKNILLSWTGQLRGGVNSGIYQVQLAMLAFDDIPLNPAATGSSSNYAATATHSSSASSTKHRHKPVNTAFNMVEKGKGKGSRLSSFFGSIEHGSPGQSALFGSALSLLGVMGSGFLGL